MARTAVWANIVCHEDMTPYLLIVTDGHMTNEVEITNCSIEFVKRKALEFYDVFADHILVSQIMDGVQNANLRK